MTLEEIEKVASYHFIANRDVVLTKEQYDWLIAEVKRLRVANENHRQTLAGVRDSKTHEQSKQWARDALSGYLEPVESTILKLQEEVHRLRGGSDCYIATRKHDNEGGRG